MKTIISLPGWLLLLAGWGASVSAGTTNIVTLSGTSFSPPDLTIQVGDTITFTNKGGFHSVVCQGTDAFCGSHPTAQSAPWGFSFTYANAGTYPFRCTVHSANFTSGMHGSVTVQTPTNTPPTLEALKLIDGGLFRFTISGKSGLQEIVESSPDLVHWTPVSTNLTGESYTNAVSPDAALYFRAVQQ
ncbi:MAG TPA: plastocyanin/azurin family copper-binding protein [Candidatus Limnocylindria bacterium]|nr:plastocyanin/azurin family copper-binding protein [Candidatus Limnocylindria bacterium]